MYERILIPTDGSENVARAIEHGLTIAGQFGASVHVLSVVPAIVKRDRLRHDPDEEAENACEQVRQRAQRDGLDVVTEIRKGEPGEEILAYSEENDIDAIVMGTHGRSGAERVILGSVAEEVVRNAPIPVMTVHQEE